MNVLLPAAATAPLMVAVAASVRTLPLPANAMAVPPLARIAPASNMLTECALAIRMPFVPESTPELEMPPVKVAPPIRTAVCEARIWLALSIRMPCRLALIEPVSTMAPLIVVDSTKIALGAAIAPVLAMLPLKVVRPSIKKPVPSATDTVPATQASPTRPWA